MKSLFALIFMLASLQAFSQTATVVIVSPKMPVNCLTDNHRLVNWVYDLKTIDETEDEAIVQFTTQYGQCVNGRTQPYIINFADASAFAMRDGMVWPWQKEGVDVELTSLSAAEVIVTLTFNKRVLFKKKDENHLSFFFEPGITAPPVYYQTRYGMQIWAPRYRFPWNIDVYLDGEAPAERLMRIQIR